MDVGYNTREYQSVTTGLEVGRNFSSGRPDAWRYGVATEASVARRLELLGELHGEKGDGTTELILNATSLGGARSTMESRYRWEGDRIPPGLLRLSVGLEDVEPLWADLAQTIGR